MLHQHGLEVYLIHGETRYDELRVIPDKPSYEDLCPQEEGRYHTSACQAAVHQVPPQEVTEKFEVCLKVLDCFNFFSATVLHVRIVVDDHGKQIVQEIIVPNVNKAAGSYLDKDITATFSSDLYLPRPWKDSSISSISWSAKKTADAGSVAIFVTRGHASIPW